MAKACKFNLFKKEGSASKTCYLLSSVAHNNYESSLNRNQGDITQTVFQVVQWAINHPSTPVKEIITQNGRKLTKVISDHKVEENVQSAIDQLIVILNLNKDLKAENELLREEIERLKKYESYYQSIKEIKL